jgi:hypothetical protein
MAFEVKIEKTAVKRLAKLSKKIREKFFILVFDLKERGPLQPEWPNFSKLGKEKYHCHLDYHHVACWYHKAKTISIEVYYVGSRENAPY